MTIDSNISEIKVLDFTHLSSLTFTKPVYVSYKSDVLSSIKSWKDAYVFVMKKLIKEYPQCFYSGMSFTSSGRIYIGKSNSMNCPRRISNDLYLETNLSAANIAHSIKYALDLCAISYDDVIIRYISSDNKILSKQNVDNESISTGNTVSENTKLEISDELKDECNLILLENFEDGYRLENYMHQKRFLNLYDSNFGGSPVKEINELDELLKQIGRVIEGRIFPYEGNDSNDVINEVIDCIIKTFDDGASVIYYECLFEKFKDRLIHEANIYSEEVLKSVLHSNNKLNDYKFNKNYINRYNGNEDIVTEIEQILISSHLPVSYNDISKIMWYVPIDSIRNAVARVPGKAYIGESSFIYAPNFNISSNELNALINAMHNTIYSNGYIVAKNLYDLFISYCPMAAMDSNNYKDTAIREILKVLLGDKFNFSSSVITELGTSLTYGDIYEEYAREHDRLSNDELKALSEELGTQIYWSSILNEMIRISPTELVNKRLFEFDIDAIDNHLETICDEDYVAIKDIRLFISFPPINYKWNEFILYSYLLLFSRKFSLQLNGFSEKDCFGLMLKNSSTLKNYDEIAADYLSKNNSWNNEEEAINCLINAKFQKGKSCKNIASIVKKAKQKRNNR